MCFTINVNIVKEEMERRFNANLLDPEEYRPSYYYSAFSFPEIPVIPAESAGEIHQYHWGLIPFWSKDKEFASSIRTKTGNAKAETLTQKPSFRGSVQSKRCLVITRGFFEWQKRNNESIPYYIYLKGEPVFALAGLCDSWNDPESGETLNTFSIITTKANPLLAKIHNTKKRMPVILTKDNESKWLDREQPVTNVLKLLKPYQYDNLQAHTISKLISKRNVEKNVPELIEPYDYNSDKLF